MNWTDFNDADDQNVCALIPENTLVKVRIHLKPGGYDDASMGWTGGYATQGLTSGAIYLNCEFVVLEGPYASRRIWSRIGLYSPKGPEWAQRGRAFIKGILNSARHLSAKDKSSHAQAKRQIKGFGDLDGLIFVGKVTISKDTNGQDKNELNIAITPDYKDYATAMGAQASAPVAAPRSSSPPTWR